MDIRTVMMGFYIIFHQIKLPEYQITIANET